jgi:hypothetical protein
LLGRYYFFGMVGAICSFVAYPFLCMAEGSVCPYRSVDMMTTAYWEALVKISRALIGYRLTAGERWRWTGNCWLSGGSDHDTSCHVELRSERLQVHFLSYTYAYLALLLVQNAFFVSVC